MAETGADESPAAQPSESIFGGRTEGTGRVEAFSDGVFAIAITLLVLNLDIPSNLPDGEVWPHLRLLWPEMLSAGISFIVIGIYWGSHHATFRLLAASDGHLLIVNLAHLATIVFLPFPTLVLAEYAGTFAAVALYAGTLTATGLTSTLLWWTAWRRKLTGPAVDRNRAIDRMVGLLTTPAVFAGSILLALANPSWAMYSWALSAFADRPATALIRRMGGRSATTGS